MKASRGFGLSGHARFLIPVMLRAIQLDKWCDVSNIIIRLSSGKSDCQSDLRGIPQAAVIS